MVKPSMVRQAHHERLNLTALVLVRGSQPYEKRAQSCDARAAGKGFKNLASAIASLRGFLKRNQLLTRT
jgi:hypothetical protein